MKAELDDSKFTKTYNLSLANILTEEDHKKNLIDITRLKHKARKAEQSYKKQADEWNVCAVRDEDYSVLDEKSALKIEKIKAREQKSWARFEAKALNNGWSSDKIARETQKLIEELDIALKNEFGLDLDLDYGLE